MVVLGIISYELIDAGVPIEHTASPAGSVWHYFMQWMTKQEGTLKVCWGRETENPAIVMVFIGCISFFIFFICADV